MNIIELAREAGFECDRDGHIFADDPDGVCDEELERFAALVRAALAEQPAEQEPFGYLWPTGTHPEFRFTQQERNGVDGMPVYTAPQPRREVELTDDAITHMAAQSLLYEENPPQGFDAAVRSFARAVIEAYKAKQGETK